MVQVAVAEEAAMLAKLEDAEEEVVDEPPPGDATVALRVACQATQPH